MRKDNHSLHHYYSDDEVEVTQGHGWISTPVSRTAFAISQKWLEQSWQSTKMDGMKNFPLYTNGDSSDDLLWFPEEGGPFPDSIKIFNDAASPVPDHFIFSGGQKTLNRDIVNVADSELMMNHGVIWPVAEVQPGQYLLINWHYQAKAATRGYRYFITKDDWDPMRRAIRNDFEEVPFASIMNITAPLSAIETQTIKLPSNKKGRHIILALWMLQAQGSAFYSAFDVDFGEGEGGGETEGDYPQWELYAQYEKGQRVSYLGRNYECNQAHTAYTLDWAPSIATTLWNLL